jgi:transposase
MLDRPKNRIFASVKKAAVERMLKGENSAQLARELGVRRKLLYEWKQRWLEGKPFLTNGRPPKLRLSPAEAKAQGEVEQLRQGQQRIAELERLLGQQAAKLDFFKQALQQVDDLLPKPSGGSVSSPSSGSGTESAGKAR